MTSWLVTGLEADLPNQSKAEAKPIQTTRAPPLSPSSSPGHQKPPKAP